MRVPVVCRDGYAASAVLQGCGCAAGAADQKICERSPMSRAVAEARINQGITDVFVLEAGAQRVLTLVQEIWSAKCVWLDGANCGSRSPPMDEGAADVMTRRVREVCRAWCRWSR